MVGYLHPQRHHDQEVLESFVLAFSYAFHDHVPFKYLVEDDVLLVSASFGRPVFEHSVLVRKLEVRRERPSLGGHVFKLAIHKL